MAFEIAVGSAEDVARMSAWADDEGWNPGNTDGLAFHAADPGAFLIGRLDGTPLACISVVRYGAGFGFLGYYIARPEIRGKGYGKALLAHLAKTAFEAGAVCVDWSVLDWNKPSIDFYDSIGAKAVKGWYVYRLENDALKKLGGG